MPSFPFVEPVGMAILKDNQLDLPAFESGLGQSAMNGAKAVRVGPTIRAAVVYASDVVAIFS